MLRLEPLLFAIVVTLPSCGGSGTPPTDAAVGTDAPASGLDAPAIDAPPEPDAPVLVDAAGADAGAACGYVDTIDRGCTTDADCSVGVHQTDCCGNSVMLGYRTTDHLVYTNGESACQASYPGCGCPAGLPVTDSEETVTDTSAVLAACVSRGPRNVCLTYLTMRPSDGR